jgi:hypothetical protein
MTHDVFSCADAKSLGVFKHINLTGEKETKV